jgi:hypothetical protein
MVKGTNRNTYTGLSTYCTGDLALTEGITAKDLAE